MQRGEVRPPDKEVANERVVRQRAAPSKKTMNSRNNRSLLVAVSAVEIYCRRIGDLVAAVAVVVEAVAPVLAGLAGGCFAVAGQMQICKEEVLQMLPWIRCCVLLS